MNASRWIVALGAAIVVAVTAIVLLPSGGQGGPPPLAYGKASCAQCRMIVGAPGFGAQVHRGGGHWDTFDDVGCLVRALKKSPAPAADVWVEDHAGSGFVRASTSSFVRVAGARTPMGSGLLAFARAADAEAHAKATSAKRLTFEELLAPAAVVDVAPFTALEASFGKDLYVRECAACHGERGDGAGPAAAFLDPKPRDFTKRLFKLRTTESGKPPHPGDVLATLEHGMPGSAMPSFAFLPEQDKRRVGAYVFKLAGLLDTPVAEPIADPGEPPQPEAASLARGAELWAKMGCPACHGEQGRGDGPSALGLTDSWGHPVRPRDLATAPMRGGDAPRDIWFRVFAGIDGTPMPAFGDSITDPADRWALVAHVSFLRDTTKAAPLPPDAIAAGRAIAERTGCRGCHVLDDGKGGDAGPDLRLSAKKLRPEWVHEFLDDPRAPGKIYPWRAHRMPDLALTTEENDALGAYLAAISRKNGAVSSPDPASFPADKLATGKMTFVVKCAQCHALGNTIKTPLASQQGPDLVYAPERLDWDWTKEWILDPKRFDPKTKMVVPGVTPDEADAVRMFIWKTARQERPARQTAELPPPKQREH